MLRLSSLWILLVMLCTVFALNCKDKDKTSWYPLSPVVLSVTPNYGVPTGGTFITIVGDHFQKTSGTTIVLIGGSEALSTVTNSTTEITCLTPSGSAGPADVTVINPDNQAGTLPAGFTYNNQPSVTGVTVPSGVLSAEILLEYILLDQDSNSCAIVVQFSLDGGLVWSDVTEGSGGDGSIGLASSPTGTSHTYVWDSSADGVAVSAPNANVRLKVVPSDCEIGIEDISDSFTVDNRPWSSTEMISTPAGDGSPAGIAVDSAGIVHIAWSEDGIYYANSSDWVGSMVKISIRSSYSYEIGVAVDSNDIVHVVWDTMVPVMTLQVYYANSTDWAATQTDISDTWDKNSQCPDICVDSNDIVHVVWEEGSTVNSNIYYTNSSDWIGCQTDISNTPGDWSFAPNLAVDSLNVIHVVWRDDVGGQRRIYYSNSTNWAGTRTSINNSDGCGIPMVAVDSNRVAHVMWNESNVLYYANSTNWSSTLAAIIQGNYLGGIAIDSADVVHIVWQTNIYYANSTYWQGTKLCLSSEGSSPGIAIALDDVVHVVWLSSETGSRELYYSHKP